MANLKPVFSTEATLLSTGLNSLANGGAASSSEQDNSTDRYLDIRVDVEMAAAAANTGYVVIYALEGDATGKLSDTANRANMRALDSIQLNGTTAVRKSILVKDVPKFWAVRVINDSGGALASSGNTVKFTGINFENV